MHITLDKAAVMLRMYGLLAFSESPLCEACLHGFWRYAQFCQQGSGPHLAKSLEFAISVLQVLSS